MTKLHLGCGDVILDDWINLDINPTPRTQVKDDATSLEAIPQASIDEIYASWLVHLFDYVDVPHIFKMWKTKLVDGGLLRLVVPNWGPHNLAHSLNASRQKWGSAFSYTTLELMLKDVGYSDVGYFLPMHDDFSRRQCSLNVVAKSSTAERPQPKWYALGDSHVWVFTQGHAHPGLFKAKHPVYSIDGRFQVNRLGPWLAKDVCKEEQQDIILSEIEVVGIKKILFSFGEIDCRCWVVPRAKKFGRTISDVCLEVAMRYTSLIRKVIEKGFEVTVWAAPLLTGGPCYNPNAPIRGTYEECRHAVECLNDHLCNMADEVGFKFVSIYDYLVEKHRTRTRFYVDHIHLDPRKVWPFIEEALCGLS